jgi:putative Holliday junction resolvase
MSGTIPSTGRVLGVDLGSRRVGVAVSDSDQRVATVLTTLTRGDDPGVHRRALARLVAEYEAAGVVVGLPRSLSGRIGPAAESALAEVAALRGELPVAVETVDERLSTVAAAAGLRAAGRDSRASRQIIDAAAATVALQTWLDGRAAGARGE